MEQWLISLDMHVNFFGFELHIESYCYVVCEFLLQGKRFVTLRWHTCMGKVEYCTRRGLTAIRVSGN